MTDQDDAARYKALLLHAAEYASGLHLTELTSWRLSPEEKKTYDAKVARLGIIYRGQQAMMDRYLDSRDAATDGPSNEWVMTPDPQSRMPVAVQMPRTMTKETKK